MAPLSENQILYGTLMLFFLDNFTGKEEDHLPKVNLAILESNYRVHCTPLWIISKQWDDKRANQPLISLPLSKEKIMKSPMPGVSKVRKIWFKSVAPFNFGTRWPSAGKLENSKSSTLLRHSAKCCLLTQNDWILDSIETVGINQFLDQTERILGNLGTKVQNCGKQKLYIDSAALCFVIFAINFDSWKMPDFPV